MTRLGRRIRERRESLGWTQKELADKMNYKDKSTIAKIESGVNDVTQSKIALFADVLDTTVSYLMGWTNNPDRTADTETVYPISFSNEQIAVEDFLKQVTEKIEISLKEELERNGGNLFPKGMFPAVAEPSRMIPILGSINCGEAMYTDDNIEGYIDTALSDAPESDEFFWMKAKGNSMINAGISEGDALLIRQQSDVDSGDIAVVAVGDNEATLKRVKKQDGAIILQAENPAYEPRIFFGDNAKDVRIIGRLMQLRKKF